MRVNESRADVGNEIYAPPRPLYFWALWGSSGVLRRPPAGPEREPSALSRSHAVNRLCIRGEDTNDGKCLIPRPRSAPVPGLRSFPQGKQTGDECKQRASEICLPQLQRCRSTKLLRVRGIIKGEGGGGGAESYWGFCCFRWPDPLLCPFCGLFFRVSFAFSHKVFTGRVCSSG